MCDVLVNISSETFGHYLRQWREEGGYSQEQIAMGMGISQKSYWLLENGRTKITLEYMQLVADVLDIEVWELLNGYRQYLEQRKTV